MEQVLFSATWTLPIKASHALRGRNEGQGDLVSRGRVSKSHVGGKKTSRKNIVLNESNENDVE